MLWLLLVTFLSFTICDPKRIKFRGREYLIYDQAHKACYSEAKAICKLQKGKLAKLTSADVRDFLASHLTCHSYIGQYKFEKFEEGAACLTAWSTIISLICANFSYGR